MSFAAAASFWKPLMTMGYLIRGNKGSRDVRSSVSKPDWTNYSNEHDVWIQEQKETKNVKRKRSVKTPTAEASTLFMKEAPDAQQVFFLTSELSQDV